MLKEKTVFIAGSSRGIGYAIAHAFLREGAKVVVTGRRSEALAEAHARLLADAGEGRVFALQGDLTTETDVRRALDATLSFCGGLDAVVANVGSGAARGGWELGLDDWRSSLDVNLLGGMALATAALPHLISQGGGSITFISSIAGREAISAPVTYSAAKAALLSAVKSLSRLVGQHGVRVNTVAPGNVLFPGGTWDRKRADDPDGVERYIRAEVPLQRLAQPEEVADAVVFLSSERASFVTGACLVIDGGQTRAL